MRKWTIILLIPFLLAACQEEQEPSPTHPDVNQTVLDPGQSMARMLSVHIGRKVLRDYLKAELMKKFDGDYNFLIALHKNALIDGQIELERLLEDEHGSNTLDMMLEKFPLLQIAMPTIQGRSVEEWNTEAQIPIVVYRPADADLNQLTKLPAYNYGRQFYLDLTKEPEVPVLVIGNNERTIAVPEGKVPNKSLPFGIESSCLNQVESLGSFGYYEYYLKNDFETCHTGGSASGGGGSIDGCDRDRFNSRDHVSRARFTTMNYMREAEHYLDGNPELYFVVTLASKNPSGFASLRKSFPSRDRSQWKDCGIFSCVTEWHEYNQPVFNWDPEVFGNLVRYDWFEEDFSTAKIDITLGLTSKFENVSVSGNVKISISKKDYFLHQDFVNYCDRTANGGTDYNTGKLYFTITNP